MFLMEEILNQLVVDVYENLTIYGVLYMPAGFKPDFFQHFQILSGGVKFPVSGSLSPDAFDTAWNLTGWIIPGWAAMAFFGVEIDTLAISIKVH